MGFGVKNRNLNGGRKEDLVRGDLVLSIGLYCGRKEDLARWGLV